MARLLMDWGCTDEDAGQCAREILAEFLVVPRYTDGTEYATVSMVREGEAPGKLLPLCTLTDARLDIQTYTTGSRVYLAGCIATSDTEAGEAINRVDLLTTLFAVWGAEYLRINAWRRDRMSGGYIIECSQAADVGYAKINGKDTCLRLVEPSPPRPCEEWLPAERDRAIRDLVGKVIPRPSVLVPDWASTPMQLVRCDPWSVIPLPEERHA
ncbi:hypothetical protein OG874_00260 [Nocardia sp. NBC_00565]|uniref:hypothetical protein n=1 Tax=Nocardia sp. NBC_00565 TaxID=2975993 RepID=UPI002E80DB34|nr:hypothetical protein [Nocardia sp. NBC_00565]WUC03687.1 hypothetical protein OG874_00260 [Nocardia sp. NBC_00565]